MRDRLVRSGAAIAVAVSLLACEGPPDRAVRAADPPHGAVPWSPPSIRVEPVEVPGDLPAYVLRGARGPARMVFLHGMCGHGQGYVQAFQGAAAEKGTVVVPAGDVACGADPAFRRWSMDVERIDARIEAAFAAAGLPLDADAELVVIGMSQGALRAEALAARFPDRYTHAVFMSSPRPPVPASLHALRGAVLMAGEHEGTWPMRQGALALERAGVPATFIAIPGGRHGELRDGERVMDHALDWLWANARSAPGPS